jgi:hypothetical protein
MQRKAHARAVNPDPAGRDAQRGIVEQGMAGLNVRVHTDRAAQAQKARRRPFPSGALRAGAILIVLAAVIVLLLALG